MEKELEVNIEEEVGGTVFSYDDEDKFFRDVVAQMKLGKSRIYIYNKKVLERVEKKYPGITIKRRDFYWEVINK